MNSSGMVERVVPDAQPHGILSDYATQRKIQEQPHR